MVAIVVFAAEWEIVWVSVDLTLFSLTSTAVRYQFPSYWGALSRKAQMCRFDWNKP